MSDPAIQDPPRRRIPFVREKRQRTPAVVTAVDLDGNIVRLCQATQRSGGATVTRLSSASLDLPPEANRTDPAIVGPALSRALAKLRIKPATVVMGIPRAQVVLRTLLLPPVQNPGELASLVHFQAGRDLPFRAEEAVIDFQVRRTIQVPQRAVAPEPAAPSGTPSASLPSTAPAAAPAPTARLEVLVAVVKRDTIAFYQQLAEIAGFKLAALGFLPHAHARCIQACHVADTDNAFALVSLRPDEVTIEVLSHDALLFSRATRFSSPTPESTEPAEPAEPAAKPRPDPLSLVQYATRETLRSLHAFSGSEPDTTISKLVVAGATGLEPDLSTALADRLGLPTTHLDPAGPLRITGESAAEAPGALAALGLALGLADRSGLPFDFLNPKRPPVQRDTRRLKILLGATAAILVLVATFGIRTTLVRRETDLYNQAYAELMDAEKKRPIYRRGILQGTTVDNWIKSSRDWTDHFAHLSTVLPPAEDLYIKKFTVTGQGSLRIAVQARSGEIIARLDKQLRAAGYDVKPSAITPGSDRYGYDFASVVELLIPAKLKIDLTKLKVPSRPSDDGSLDPELMKRGGRS
jgi:Tfp pilus assembly PilM family ATPase